MSSIAQAVIALAALIASIAIPIIINRAQKRRETLEFIHAVRTMWISIDAVVLQRDDLVEIADSIVAPDAHGLDIKARQRTWITLMILNAVYMDYLGAHVGFHSEEALKNVKESLKKYLLTDSAYQLTQDIGAYDAGFRELCREARNTVLEKQATPLRGVGSPPLPADRL